VYPKCDHVAGAIERETPNLAGADPAADHGTPELGTCRRIEGGDGRASTGEHAPGSVDHDGVTVAIPHECLPSGGGTGQRRERGDHGKNRGRRHVRAPAGSSPIRAVMGTVLIHAQHGLPRGCLRGQRRTV
jgi:hypothetical protein